jgi:FKBP-type peptidyl-prolyl cis-trans isomerase 2
LSVAKGDFVLVDYTTTVKETGEVFDTTSEDEAKKTGAYREGAAYEPMLVVVGEGWVLKGLDDALVGLEVGKEATIEVPPSQGFGERDPSKIRLIPVSRFRGARLYPGAQVDIDGRPAVVRSVGAGRVQVDFNPPLAGKTLVYRLVVRSILSDPLEKVKALVHRRVPKTSIERFKVSVSGSEVTIEVPEEAFGVEGIQAAKRGIASDIHKLMPGVEKVTFIESFPRQREAHA